MRRAFTLIELIVVIIIVGILAAMGISQYSTTVEKSRIAEAKIRIGTMKKLAFEYYLEHGSLDGIQNADIGVDDTCVPTDFFRYSIYNGSVQAWLYAVRCDSGGKTPNSSRSYTIYLYWRADTEASSWHCHYTGLPETCFGLPY